MNFVPMREVVSFAIGGGWGSETEVDGSVLTRVIRGADFPEAAEQNLSNAPLRWEKESKVNTRSLSAGDIVLEVSGGTKDRPTGRTVLITPKMVDESVSPLIPASFCRKLQINREVAEPRFVYYWLQLMHTSGRAWKHQNQSTGIANFQFEQFLDNEFLWLPRLKTQQAIAAFLGSLDDKIAANQAAISTGSELLMSLYRGVQKHTAEPFGQVCDVFGGSTPSTKVDEYWGGSINWATPTDLTALQGPWLTNTERKITEAGLRSVSSSLHPPGSILMTSRATIGHVAVAATPVTTNQGFIVIRASEELVPWIFCQLQDRVREFEAWSNGATFLEISRGNFKKLKFHRAEPQDLAEFNARAKPLLGMCKAKQSENITLVKTRDELLPLLMNGKITVREASQEAAAVGAQIPSEENEV